MNYRLFAALLVYIVSVVVAELMMGNIYMAMESVYMLFIAHVVALTFSWLAYYLLRPREQRPSFPTKTQERLLLVMRLFLALLTLGVLAGAMVWIYMTLRACMGVGDCFNLAFLSEWTIRLSSFYIVLVMTHALLPLAFWGVISVSRKLLKQQAVRPKLLGVFVPVWITLNLVGAAGLAYALSVDINSAGWPFFFTFPIYIACVCLLVFDGGVFVKWAIKLPKEKRGRKIACWLAALLSLSPIILTITYVVVDNHMKQTAKDRATTQISLKDAQQLLTDCRVDTLYREDNNVQMRLHEETRDVFGNKIGSEMRAVNPSDFEQILATARSKVVENKCGYVPTYDIQRARMKPVARWITVDEAKALICTHSWLVSLYSHGYSGALTLPASQSTGVLLAERPSVWNDDIESNIVLIGTPAEVRIILEETANPALEKCGQ